MSALEGTGFGVAMQTGWTVELGHGPLEVWHLGGQGVSTALYMRPEEGLGVVLLGNFNGLASPPGEAPILGLARSDRPNHLPRPGPVIEPQEACALSCQGSFPT